MKGKDTMRKVIQIAVSECCDERDNYEHLVALADDGTLWVTRTVAGGTFVGRWKKMPDIPQTEEKEKIQ